MGPARRACQTPRPPSPLAVHRAENLAATGRSHNEGIVAEKPGIRDAWLVAVFGAVALLPFLGQTHDVASHEIRHAEIGREMAASGDFLIPTLLGRPYQDKLPLM